MSRNITFTILTLLLDGYHRIGRDARRKSPTDERLISPTAGIRFDTSQGELRIFGPDGKPFLTYEDSTGRSVERQACRSALDPQERDELAHERDELAQRARP